ncbi:MAG: hypothetical protein IJZ03_02230 [Clostridia bacterium]|nr:hypothetical protein [Clostridia bacterium]
MKSLLTRILACLLVLTMVFAFVACGSGDKKDDNKKDDAAGDENNNENNNNNNNDDIFNDDNWDDDIVGDDDDDDDPDIFALLWAKIKTLTVPNSKLTMNGIVVADRLGKFTAENGVFTAGADQALAEITSFKLATDKKSTKIKIEYDYTGADSDSGIILGAAPAADTTKTPAVYPTTWGWEDMPYYFAFIGKGGQLRLAKVDPAAEAKWTDLANGVAIPGYTAGSKTHVVIEWDGAKALKISVGDTSLTAEGTLENVGNFLGLRAGANGAKFENFVISVDGYALDVQGRKGDHWQLKETDDHHNGGIYSGYEGETAGGQASTGVISNVIVLGAKKVTFTVDASNGANWKTETSSPNQNFGMILNVQNNDEVMPIFWETESGKPSYFYIASAGGGASAFQGKWGAMASAYSAIGDGWGYLTGEGITQETNPDFEAGEFNYGEYNTYTGIWDIENLVLSHYVDGTLQTTTTFTSYPFAKEGKWAGVRTNSGDVYYNNFDLEVNF